MKKKLLRTIAALMLSVSVVLPAGGDLPLSTGQSAHAASSVRIGSKSYSVDTEVLDLQDMGLTDKDIKNLGSFTDLTELIISDNKITDLSPVSKLTKLEKITFHNNNVSDISFAKNLKKLTVFGASNNPISDISALSGLKDLKEVWMGDNPLTDISPLKNCSKLTHVCFNNCRLKDIEALRNKKWLDTVCLVNCGLRSIEPLKDCYGLTHVYLNGNELTDISALSASMWIIMDLYADVEFTEPAPTAELQSGQLKSGTIKSGTIAVSADAAYIKLSAASKYSDLYYSVNGGKNQSSYGSKTIELTENSTIKAYAVANGTTIKSPTVTFKYKLTPAVDFNVTDTSGGKLVKLQTGASNVKLYYTTDGSTPTARSKRYTSDGIKITKSCKLRVLAERSGWTKGYYSKDITISSTSGGSGNTTDNTMQLGEGNFLTPSVSGNANIRFNGQFINTKAEYRRSVDDDKKFYDTISVNVSDGKRIEFYIAQDHKFNTGNTLKSWKTGTGVSDVVLFGFDLNGDKFNLTSDSSDHKYFDKAELKAISIDYTGKNPSVLYFYILAHDNKGNKTALEGIIKVLIDDSKNVALSGSGNTGSTDTGSTGGAYTSLYGKYSVNLGEGKVNFDGKLYTGKAYSNNSGGYDRFDIDFDNDKKYVRIGMVENCVVEGKTDDIKSYRQSKRIVGKGLAGIWVSFGGLGFYTDPEKDSFSSNDYEYLSSIFMNITTTYETYRDGVVTIRFHMEYLSFSGDEKHTIDGYCAIPYVESGEDYCTICTGTGRCQTCMGTTPGSNCPSCRGTKKCKFCKGNGSTPSLNEFSCPVCAGKGECRKCGGDGVNYDPFSEKTTRCGKCNGSGICLACDGSGFVS